MSATANLGPMFRGNTGKWDIACFDLTGAPLNLTGATVAWYIKTFASDLDSQALITHDSAGVGGVTILNAGLGTARLTLQPAETVGYPAALTVRFYTVVVTESDSTKTTVLTGALSITDPSVVPAIVDTSGGYATIDDLSIYGLNAIVLEKLIPAQQIAALASASDLIDSYLNSKFKLPLVSWGKALTQKTCEIASWTLLSLRGFDPEDPADFEVKNRYEVALKWLDGIRTGEITPLLTDSGTPGNFNGPGSLQSNTQPSSQPSPSGTLNIQTLQDGTVITTGAPRQRGWR